MYHWDQGREIWLRGAGKGWKGSRKKIIFLESVLQTYCVSNEKKCRVTEISVGGGDNLPTPLSELWDHKLKTLLCGFPNGEGEGTFYLFALCLFPRNLRDFLFRFCDFKKHNLVGCVTRLGTHCILWRPILVKYKYFFYDTA